MAEAKRVERPLSPHLQVYRIQLTSVTSILTRITGNAMIVAVILAVWWLLAAATSDAYFATANAVATSWFGDLVFTASLGLCGITTSLAYGICITMRVKALIFLRRRSWVGRLSAGRLC